VVNPGGSIGGWRAFKKGKGFRSLAVGDGLFENLIFFPILKDRLSDVWVVYLLKFLVRFHCVYSGEMKNGMFWAHFGQIGPALGRLKRPFLRGILLKTSHKDRRNGLTGKKMRGGLPRVVNWIFGAFRGS
jgi:hypothetical protein